MYQTGAKTYDLELDTEWSSEQHDLLVGIGYRYNELSSDDSLAVDYSVETPFSDRIAQFFIHDEFAFSSTTTITLGVKYEKHEGLEGLWQPTVRALSQIGRRHAVWGAWSIANTAPSASNRYVEMLVPSESPLADYQGYFGNASLKAETNKSLELGWRYRWSDSVLSDMTLYRQEHEDLMAYYPRLITIEGGGTAIFQLFDNFQTGVVQGVEWSFQWQPDSQQQFELSYQFMDSDVPGDHRSLAEQLTDPMPNTSSIAPGQHGKPRRQAIQFKHQFNKGALWFNTLINWEDRQYHWISSEGGVLERESLKNQLIANLSAGYDINPNLQVSLFASNLFGRDEVGIASSTGFRVNDYVEVPTSYHLKFDWRPDL